MSNLPLTIPDLVGFDDLDIGASETTSDLQTLFQDVYHVAIETLSSNPDDLTRGAGMGDALSGTLPVLQAKCGVLEQQLIQDPGGRITAASVLLSQNNPAPFPYVVTVNISVAGQVYGLQYGYSNNGLQPLGLL